MEAGKFRQLAVAQMPLASLDAAAQEPSEADGNKASRSGRSEGPNRNDDEDHGRRSRKSSRSKPDKGSNLLSKLKKLPIPFCRH